MTGLRERPTRAVDLAPSLPLSKAVVFGGLSIARQRERLARGVDILVATPGRLLDLIDSRSLALLNVQILA